MNKPNMEQTYYSAKQRMEETEAEKNFRKLAGFAEIEARMPNLITGRRSTFVDNITSYLGKKNPFTHVVDPDQHTVWLFDTTAYQEVEGAGQPWKMDVVTSFFVKHSGKDDAKIIADVAAVLGLADDEQAKATLTKRLQPLMNDVLPSHTVKIDLTADDIRSLGPGDRDGISNNVLHLTGDYSDGQTLTSQAVGIKTSTPLTTTFATSTGWAIISDIDDTIKKTMTASPLGILRTTFIEEPVPIQGMPELYSLIKSSLKNPPFWYLSASPYNLYPFLREFREAHYPPGSMFLREASWRNLGGIPFPVPTSLAKS